MYVIRGNFDHAGGGGGGGGLCLTSRGNFVQTEREHTQRKEKAKEAVQSSRKPSICFCFLERLTVNVFSITVELVE